MKSVRNWYQEYPTCPELSRHVECFWCATTNGSVVKNAHRVLPDGCIDIIFDLSPIATKPAKIVGTMTTPILFRPEGISLLAAVRFRPGGAIPFLGGSAAEFTDAEFELTSRWRSCELVSRMQEPQGWLERVQVLQSALLDRLVAVPDVDMRIRHAVRFIEQGAESTEKVSDRVNLSRQHLSRLFRQQVGISPKAFARVARMQKLVRYVRQSATADWSQLAQLTGYCDQSHMINECRALTGLRPTELS